MCGIVIRRICLITIILTISVHSGHCSVIQNVEVDTVSNETELVEKWNTIQSKLENLIQNGLRQIVPSLIRAGAQLDISDECSLSITSLIFGIQRLKPWAFQMIDAFGKPASAGMLWGKMAAPGAYDQCLGIEVNSDTEDGFRGQYCSLTIRPPLPPKPRLFRIDEPVKQLRNFTPSNIVMSRLKELSPNMYLVGMRLGACVPSACNEKDVQTIGESVADLMGMYARVTNCHVKEPTVFEIDQIIVLCIIFAFILMVVVATIHDVFYGDDQTKNLKELGLRLGLLRSFSIRHNVVNFLRISVKPEDEALKCLHGIKVASISWILLGHTYLYLALQTINFFETVRELGTDLAFQTILNGSLAVDTFFFVSGLLLCNMTVNLVEKHGPKAFFGPLYFLKRCLRLLPMAWLTLGLMILTPLIGSGPFWNEIMGHQVDLCRRNWWGLIFPVNNFIHPSEMCEEHTWYLSCEIQLFLCSLVFLWLLFKRRAYGFIMAAFMIVLSIIGPGLITYLLGLIPTILFSYGNPDQVYRINYLIYYQAYAHSASYAIGLLLGYFLAKTPKIKISLGYRIFGWVLATAFCLLSLYAPVIWNRPNVPTTVESVSFAALHRIGWVLGVAWLTLMCATGYGGVINSILGWKALIPLSKLVYLVYLVQFVVIWTQMGVRRMTLDWSQTNWVWLWFGHMFATTLTALLVKVFFDSPLQEVQNIVLTRLLGRGRNQLKKQDGRNDSLDNPKVARL